MEEVFDALDGESILEVGVGAGRNFESYPVRASITGIDFSPGMLSRSGAKIFCSSTDQIDVIG